MAGSRFVNAGDDLRQPIIERFWFRSLPIVGFFGMFLAPFLLIMMAGLGGGVRLWVGFAAVYLAMLSLVIVPLWLRRRAGN